MKCVSPRDPEEITTMSQTVLIYLNMNSELFSIFILQLYTLTGWQLVTHLYPLNFSLGILEQTSEAKLTLLNKLTRAAFPKSIVSQCHQ